MISELFRELFGPSVLVHMDTDEGDEVRRSFQNKARQISNSNNQKPRARSILKNNYSPKPKQRFNCIKVDFDSEDLSRRTDLLKYEDLFDRIYLTNRRNLLQKKEEMLGKEESMPCIHKCKKDTVKGDRPVWQTENGVLAEKGTSPTSPYSNANLAFSSRTFIISASC
jgi:hypothetical protein